MSRGSASVIAQVIPIIALALALELRTLSKSFEEENVDPAGKDVWWTFYPVFVQAAAMVVLAVAECHVLTQAVSDGPQPGWFWILKVAVIITFLSPVRDAAISVSKSLPKEGRWRASPEILTRSVPILVAIVTAIVLISP